MIVSSDVTIEEIDSDPYTTTDSDEKPQPVATVYMDPDKDEMDDQINPSLVPEQTSELTSAVPIEF